MITRAFMPMSNPHNYHINNTSMSSPYKLLLTRNRIVTPNSTFIRLQIILLPPTNTNTGLSTHPSHTVTGEVHQEKRGYISTKLKQPNVNAS